MKYIIASGFHGSEGADAFFDIWIANVCKRSTAESIVVVADSGSRVPAPKIETPRFIPINLSGNLGAWTDLLSGEKSYLYCGWLGVLLIGSLIAFSNETDLIFVEQDCLMFGDCIGKMYEEIGDGGIIFGARQISPPWMPCSQSLILIKHHYIPEFVRLMVSQPRQNQEWNLCEHIFARLAEQFPNKWKQFSFGCDRERPIPVDDPIFYCQKMTPDELEMLRQKGLI